MSEAATFVKKVIFLMGGKLPCLNSVPTHTHSLSLSHTHTFSHINSRGLTYKHTHNCTGTYNTHTQTREDSCTYSTSHTPTPTPTPIHPHPVEELTMRSIFTLRVDTTWVGQSINVQVSVSSSIESGRRDNFLECSE